MLERFSKDQSLYLDIECFDPKKFKRLEMSSLSLKTITDLVPNCNEDKLKEELISFS